MKRILLVLLAVTMIASVAMAGEREKGSDDKGIKWLTIDEVQVAMKKKPKKVYVDIYTDWCGWCKVMDKKTFSNPAVIKYMNDNFYAVKLDAERKDSVRFAGKMYGYEPQYRANTLAVEMLQGRMSYPTSVIYAENNFQMPQVIPGYLEVGNMEMILKYIAEDHFKNKSFEDFQKEFKPSWN